MSHGIYGVISHTNDSRLMWKSAVPLGESETESWHISMSHGTSESVMAHMNESCDIWKSAVLLGE